MKTKRAHDLAYPVGVLRGGDVYMEIGAHEGKFLDKSKLLNAKNIYHLFEPLPEMARKLREKYRRHESVHVHELAVGPDNGKQAFYRTSSLVGSTMFGDGDEMEVQTITLARALEWYGNGPEHRVRFLAINAECAEYHFLPGVDLRSVDYITIEFHPGKSKIDTKCWIERYLDHRFETIGFWRDGQPYNVWLGKNRALWEEE